MKWTCVSPFQNVNIDIILKYIFQLCCSFVPPGPGPETGTAGSGPAGLAADPDPGTGADPGRDPGGPAQDPDPRNTPGSLSV